MIIGMGVDLCDARRIAATLERFGERFSARIFTTGERARCDGRRNPAESYARRWAAKEAAMKALGVGAFTDVRFKDLEVETLESGAPRLRLHGAAAARLAALTPAGRAAEVHVSLTDEPPYAHAMVLIEARPR
ncbi:MAG: holo-ACP synthase [Pseudomonadota bacterium]